MHPLIEGIDLSEEEMVEEITHLLEDPIKMAGFLMLLKAKGETAVEILGLVKALRSKMKKLEVGFPTIDIVGTGGDQAGTANISTGSALLAAECGIPVLKHGNRAVSSKCGSADVLEAIGFDIHADPLESLRKTGFGFCFAPDYHPAMAQVRSVRKALQCPTLFNLIGPLLNPAGLDHLLFGVHKPEFVEKLAQVLQLLGTKRSLVFSGSHIDELSCLGRTEALLVTEKGIEKLVIDPEQLGLRLCKMEDLKGGDIKRNASLLKNPPKALQDTFILNAGVALFLYGKAASIQEGVNMAKHQTIKKALKKGVIAEIKRASPSKGKIGEISDPAARAKEYERSGASAISVLTSPLFEGSLDDLEKVKEAVCVPVLRKDFITTVEDLKRTKADLVLLIVSFLKDNTESMLAEARKLGFSVIVEVHSESELQIALKAGADIIGVNQRNLTDLTMHPEVYELIHQIPDRIVKIAESGVANLEDAKKRFEMGYDAILVGEALTRNANLCEEICSLKSVD